MSCSLPSRDITQRELLSAQSFTPWAPEQIPRGFGVRGTAHEFCSPVCSHSSLSSCFLAEASAQENPNIRTVAVTRCTDSRELLPKSDTADGEHVRAVTKTPSAVWHVGRTVGSEVWLMAYGEEPERHSSGGVWALGPEASDWLLAVF